MPYIIERINALDHDADALRAPTCPDCGNACVLTIGPRVEPQPMQRVGVVYYAGVACFVCGFGAAGGRALPDIKATQTPNVMLHRDDTWSTERERHDALSFEPNRHNWLGRGED